MCNIPQGHTDKVTLFPGVSLGTLGPEGGQTGFCREKPSLSGQRRGVGEPHPSLFSPCGWQFVAVFLKGDSGDLQVGGLQAPKGLLGGGPGLAEQLFLPLCPPAGFTHRLQLPLRGCLTQATSGWPLSHCLLREAPGGN